MGEAYEGEHLLVTEFGPDGCDAVCSCGWEADRPYDETEDAVEAWDLHCDAVFMEATEAIPDPGW